MARRETFFGNQYCKVRRLKQVRNGKPYWSKEWFGTRTHRGKRYTFPLGQNKEKALQQWRKIQGDLDDSEIPFETILRNHKRGYVARPEPTTKPKRPARFRELTIEDHIEFIGTIDDSLEIKTRTLQDYVACLLRVVGVGLAFQDNAPNPTAVLTKEQKAALLKLPLTIIDLRLAENFKRAILGAANSEGRNLKSAKRSANSYLRQAKALFSHGIRNQAKIDGFKLPDLSEFLGAHSFAKVKMRYQLPNEVLIYALFQAMADPERAPHRDIYIVILFALFGGLRKTEAAGVRPQDLTEANASPGVNVIETKNGLPRFAPLVQAVFAWLKTASHPGPPYLIMGTKTYRTDDLFDEANAWLRSIGWNRAKPYHELRKLYGSMIASTQGLERAKELLDHESISTTEEFYARTDLAKDICALWETFIPVPLNQLPTRSARKGRKCVVALRTPVTKRL